jgi:hypothetical protein
MLPESVSTLGEKQMPGPIPGHLFSPTLQLVI